MRPELLNLAPVVLYKRERLSWAFAIIRQFESLLKTKNMLEPDVYLSVQDLINKTPKEYMYGDGDIIKLKWAPWALLNCGIVTEERCPLTFALDVVGPTCGPEVPVYRLRKVTIVRKAEVVVVEGDEVEGTWRMMIKNKLSVAPFAASVLCFSSYNNNLGGKDVCKPTEEEWAHYLLVKLAPLRLMFLTASILIRLYQGDDYG
ncbi:PREDICTED: uncharacterized protein LOC104708486 [Camelina sativa]|uniref:Uncharacterized protein LOC104708486 n=1 Tax=Camelina sativa TaxID=90675 RepID=A0ABM0TAM8_CAMSA|nr:PREDICTED: uncharacterized protein LOC104708486 [Camelina sativa]